MLKQLVTHTSNYSIGGVLLMLAGVISFPIVTRLFSLEEFGILNLISATLTLLTGLAKLGMQHSIVRFHGEVQAGQGVMTLRHYYSTVVFGMAGVGAMVALGTAAVSQVVPLEWWNDRRVPGLLWLTSMLIFVRVVDSGLANILRAEERSGVYTLYEVLKRYATLLLVLATLFSVMRTVYAFYLAVIVTESVAVALLAVRMTRARGVVPQAFSPATFRAMLVFGIPMVAYELAGVVLSLGDRYVIQASLGNVALGLYSGGYNLCQYVQGALVVSVGQAIMPLYVRSFEKHGPRETRRFIERALHFYLMFGTAVIAGVSVVAPELLAILASDKYRASAAVVPYIIAAMVVDGMVPIVGAGLFIHKRTLAIAMLVAGAALVNIGLNVVLVPAYGIVGAAQATLVSCTLLAAGTLAVSARRMPVSFPWREAVKFVFLALLMYLAVDRLRSDHDLVGLVAKGGLGVLTYLALIIAFDAQMRKTVEGLLSRWRGGGG